MKRTCAYLFSIALLSCSAVCSAQDTIPYPKKFSIGADLYGPVYKAFEKNIFTFEGFLSFDTDTGKSLVAEAGWSEFSYSQYNYEFLSKGAFLKLGMDFNLMDPGLSNNRYFAGIGIRYGTSLFFTETPSLTYENYWGSVSGSVPYSTNLAHYLEVTPGIRAELFRNIMIGWTVRLRFLIYSGTGPDDKPVFIPGFGNGTKRFSPGINYYIILSLPYRKGK